MNEKIKNYLGISLIVGVLAFGYGIMSIAGSVGKSINPGSLRSFSVSAEGKATGVPDVAEFTFSVITEGGEKLAELQTENTEKMNKAIAFLKEQGVKKEDIKTSQYSVNPRYEYYSCGPVIYGADSRKAEPCPPPKIVGYTITQSASVKIRDFAKAGDIVSGVVKSGANQASSLNFTIDDPTSVQDDARAEAIEKAQKKAEKIAKAGGFRVGKLISIYESAGGYPPIYYAKGEALGMGGDMAESAPSPSIEPGSEDVQVSVTLTYEIR